MIPGRLAASELGIRLEVVNGLPIWEAQPKRQKAVERTAQSICPGNANCCRCAHALEVYVQFSNGLKRPDIAIFCRELSEEERAGPDADSGSGRRDCQPQLRGQRSKDRSTLPVAGRRRRGGVRSLYAVGLARPRRSLTLMEIFAMRLRGQYLT